MKVIFFTKGDRVVASSRVRAYIVAGLLQEKGFDTEVLIAGTFPWWRFSLGRFREFVRNWHVFSSLGKDDLVYLHKTVWQWDLVIIALLRKIFWKQKYAFDFDDAIFMYAGLKTRLLASHAACVVVGGHYLYEYAQKYNKNVALIPTSVDVDLYVPAEKGKEKKVIGWMGVADPPSLRLLIDPLKNLTQRNIPFRFVLIGARNVSEIYEMFREIENLDLKIIDDLDWTDTKNNVSAIQKFSIGVAPLVDDEWNRHKCAFKAIEYMACGVPTITSNMGEFPYLIKDGENGFLASTADEWTEKLARLLEDDILASTIGAKGRETIKKRYSYQVNIDKLADTLCNI